MSGYADRRGSESWRKRVPWNRRLLLEGSTTGQRFWCISAVERWRYLGDLSQPRSTDAARDQGTGSNPNCWRILFSSRSWWSLISAATLEHPQKLVLQAKRAPRGACQPRKNRWGECSLFARMQPPVPQLDSAGAASGAVGISTCLALLRVFQSTHQFGTPRSADGRAAQTNLKTITKPAWLKGAVSSIITEGSFLQSKPRDHSKESCRWVPLMVASPNFVYWRKFLAEQT